MPRQKFECSYNEKTGLYRKQIKNEVTGKYDAVYARSPAELREKVEARRAELAEGARREAAPLFYEYAQKWYALYAPTVGEKQRQSVKTNINKHICPVIGSIPVSDLTTDDAQAVMTACADLKNETQKKILSTLRRILKAAVKRGYLKESPAAELRAGGDPPDERIPLTKEQQQALISSLAGHRCQLFCALCLYAGLRPEEALGLCWDCVFLDAPAPYITVRRACHWPKTAAVINDKLKSGAARRNIPIPPQLVELLAAAYKARIGDVVVANQNGAPMSKSAFRRMWNAIELRTARTFHYKTNGREYTRELKLGDRAPYTNTVIAIDFKIVPYQLRHTFVTELILSGADVATTQYLAGHSDPKVTLKIYTHLIKNAPTNTQSAVVNAFS